MEYIVRLREIIVHEFCVESVNAKGAFLTAIKKAHRKGLNKSTAIGRFIELEHIQQGNADATNIQSNHYGINQPPKKNLKSMVKVRKTKGHTN